MNSMYVSSTAINSPPQGGRPKSPYEQELQAAGIKPTGSAAGDLAALKAAAAGELSDSNQINPLSQNLIGAERPKRKPPGGGSPYETELALAGLKPTGTKEGDLKALQQFAAQQSENGSVDSGNRQLVAMLQAIVGQMGTQLNVMS